VNVGARRGFMSDVGTTVRTSRERKPGGDFEAVLNKTELLVLGPEPIRVYQKFTIVLV
jgi:hypothetical protein